MSKKYNAIAKVGYNPTTKENICVKYRFNKIDNFISFINSKYNNVYWINIFDKQTRQLKYTWGKKKGLEEAKY